MSPDEPSGEQMGAAERAELLSWAGRNLKSNAHAEAATLLEEE